MTDALSALRETLERTLLDKIKQRLHIELRVGLEHGDLVSLTTRVFRALDEVVTLDVVMPPIAAALAEKDAQIAALHAERDTLAAKYLAVIREVETPLPPDGADYE